MWTAFPDLIRFFPNGIKHGITISIRTDSDSTLGNKVNESPRSFAILRDGRDAFLAAQKEAMILTCKVIRQVG